MAQKFLQGGDKVKVSIRFRGRQITHSEIGMQVMQDFAARCAEVSSVERPSHDGRPSYDYDPGPQGGKGFLR